MPINKSNNTLISQLNNSNLFNDDKKSINNSKVSKKKLENTIVIKITDDHKEILERHFKEEKGLALSSGIRQIIFEYLKEKNLI